ncbi:MAG: DUF3566 domain-containing protein [Acidimicrobiia bacterium]
MPTAKTTSKTARRTSSSRNTKLSARIRKERSYRQVIGRIDVWSVFKLSLCFHTAAMLLSVVALIVLWTVAGAVGLVSNFEKFLGTVFEIKQFSFVDFQVLMGVLAIGLTLVLLMTILSVIAASLYNVFAEGIGGVEIYVVEETTGVRI